MNLRNTLLTAAFGLIMSALSAQPANIPISSLPFAITDPGTYVVTRNLSFPSSATGIAAITISTAISGSVVLDLKGFTLTGGGGDSIGIGIGVFAGTNGPNTSPITIRNGSLVNFGFGVWAEGFNFAVLSDMTVNKLVINLGSGQSGPGAGVIFASAVSSTISNCSFHGGAYGIEDTASGGGNRYINDSFLENPLLVTIQNGGIPAVLNHCQFDGPPAN
jgi:nitrous oxidase accessory protein NosD